MLARTVLESKELLRMLDRMAHEDLEVKSRFLVMNLRKGKR